MTTSPCQLNKEKLIGASKPKFIEQFLSDLVWRIKNFFGVAQRYSIPGSSHNTKIFPSPALEDGDLIEVRGFNYIKSTLDSQGQLDGLYFMPKMANMCGQRHVVFKHVNRILLESTGELRKLNRVVILKDVICDGRMFYGCDRSCFLFWKEDWLKLIQKGGENNEGT